jgi:hypothetical protein
MVVSDEQQVARGIRPLRLRWALACVLVAALCPTVSLAQELSPRAYWPTPIGTRFASLGYAYTEGDTITDPSLPVTGVNSYINTIQASYLESFDLMGRTANFILEIPFSWGQTTGRTPETQRIGRDFKGQGDIAATISVNLLGAPAMDPQEFLALLADPGPIIGASLRVVVPTGEYHDDRIVNVGANRWATKLEFGTVLPLAHRWVIELELGVWAFQDNDDFVAGKREQEAIYSVETHFVRTINPQVWASLDLNYYHGGRTTVDGRRLEDLQRSSKIGGTIVFPMDRQRVIRFGYSWGSVTESDNDFSTVLVSFSQKLP